MTDVLPPDRPGRWVEVAPSEHAHEREGLDHVRAHLPSRAPWFAWSNVELVAMDGTPHEIDLVVLGPAGFHVVELKAWSGTIELDPSGGEHDWLEHPPGRGRPLRRRSPLTLTRRKAQSFRSWLEHHAAGSGTRVPWVAESLFLHGSNVDCRLPERLKARVFGREGAEDGLRPLVSERLTAGPERGPSVDLRWSNALVNLVSESGLRRPSRLPTLGHWVLEDGGQLDSGWGWRDDLAHHDRFPDEVVRVRRWFAPPGTSAADEAAVRRAAAREYLTLRGLDHPGLVVARDSFEVDGAVAALVFDHDPAALPLRSWLAAHDAPLEVRLELVRSLAEVVRYAHGHGLVHRGLDPDAVLVAVGDGGPTARVKDWQHGGQLEPSSTTGTTQLGYLGTREEDAARVYAAPEVLAGSVVDRRAADVFSLGALAHLVLTGHEPEADTTKLRERLEREGGLDVSAHLDSPPDSLVLAVLCATSPVVGQRTGSVETLLADLDAVLDELTRPEEAEPRAALDPFDSAPGDELEGGLLVERLLGQGATSRAYKVRRPDGSVVVLKAARDDSRADRLHDEARVLAGLPEDRELVHLVDGPVSVGGRTCLLVEHAGDHTLAEQLGGRRLTLDQLRRWGDDLLSLLQVLERSGVFHRDLKPANLGVRLRAGDGQKHLVLFDFSLAGVPLDDLTAGTAGYRDPFLGTGRRRSYDAAAEAFSAAVTLHEMATGSLPVWGDGRTPPEQLEDEVALRPGAFDLAVADELVSFFARALARDAGSRFDNAEAMRVAWDQVFLAAEQRESRRSPDEMARAATGETPLSRSGLSATALSALEQLQVSTVGDLLSVPVFDLNRLQGARQSTKDEVVSRAREWRDRLLSSAGPTLASVDSTVQRLLPAADDASRRSVRLMLGHDDPVSGAACLRWPTPQQVRDEVELDRQEVADSWARYLQDLPPRDVAALADDVGALLESLGGAAEVGEVARRLVDLRGSYADEPLRGSQAVGLVRVATEAGGVASFRRSGSVVVLAGGAHLVDPASREEALEAAVLLGRAATDLAQRNPLLPGTRALEELRRVVTGSPLEGLDDDRLRDLAAAAGGVAVSGRQELYPVGMSAARAVLLCAQALVPGPHGLAVAQVEQRVRARYPQAQPLPPRPRLDELVGVDEVDLRWDGTAYVSRTVLRTTAPSTLTSASHHAVPLGEEDRVTGRLTASSGSRSFLALAVPQREARAATTRLVHELGAQRLDLGVEAVGRLRGLALANGADWAWMLGVDAPGAPESDHRELDGHLRWAVDQVLADALGSGTSPLLLTGAGVLVRHRCTDLVKPLASLQRSQPRAVWLLAPQPSATATPTLDGASLPLDSPPSQWLALPRTWAANSTATALSTGSTP